MTESVVATETKRNTAGGRWGGGEAGNITCWRTGCHWQHQQHDQLMTTTMMTMMMCDPCCHGDNDACTHGSPRRLHTTRLSSLHFTTSAIDPVCAYYQYYTFIFIHQYYSCEYLRIFTNIKTGYEYYNWLLRHTAATIDIYYISMAATILKYLVPHNKKISLRTLSSVLTRK